MRKTTRLLALSLVLMLCLGMFAACDPATTTSPTPSPSTPASGTPTATPTPPSPTPAPVAGMEGWEPFANRVSITVPVYDRAKEGYPAVDDNYWTKWVQKEFGDKWNIDVKYVAIPRNDVMVTYSMLIAGKETPTIMMEYDYPKVAQWATEGAMQPINLDDFAFVAPTFYNAMVEHNQLGYTDLGGETFFVLTERPYFNTDYTYVTYVRMDWLREAGYDHVPKNYTEQKDAIAKIIEKGHTAPVGLGVPSAAYMTNFLFRENPVDEKEWVMHSSLGTAGFSWEAGKRQLQRLNEEYNAGWYNKEFDLIVNSSGASADDIQAAFINGELYRYGGYMSPKVDWLNAFYEKNPGAELAVEFAGHGTATGAPSEFIARANNPFGMIVGFSSYASAEQLQAAWMLMEWMLQPDNLFVLENGVEGVTYTIGADGLPVVDGAYRGPEMLNHNMNIDMACLVHAAKKVGTIEQTIKAISPQGLPQDFYQQMLDNYNYLKSAAALPTNVYFDPVFGVQIASESEYSATLLSLYKEYYCKVIKAAPADFEALYTQFSKDYLDAGYQEIIDERLAAYEAGMTSKLIWNQ